MNKLAIYRFVYLLSEKYPYSVSISYDQVSLDAVHWVLLMQVIHGTNRRKMIAHMGHFRQPYQKQSTTCIVMFFNLLLKIN